MRLATALLLAATLAPPAAAQFHVRSPNQARPGYPIYSPYYNPGPVYGSSPVALGSSLYSGSPSYPLATYGRSYAMPYSSGVSYSQPMVTYPQSYAVMPGATYYPAEAGCVCPPAAPMATTTGPAPAAPMAMPPARPKVAETNPGLPALRLSLVDQTDPIQVGQVVTYTLQVINQGTAPAKALTLKLDLPAELQYLSCEGTTVAKADGQIVAFGNVESLAAGATVTWTIKAKALKVADVRTKAALNCEYLKTPVIADEPTRLIP